jgi:hypothetical protein
VLLGNVRGNRSKKNFPDEMKKSKEKCGKVESVKGNEISVVS